MAKNISKKVSVKDSSAKTLGKTPPGDKTLGLDPEIRFYAIEDGDDTEEGEEAEIIVIHESSLTASKKNLVNRKFPYINTFDHECPTVVSAMRDLTAGVFEHLDINSPMDVDKMVAYTQRILKGCDPKKYREVLVECRQLAKELSGDEWNLGKLKGLSTDDFWTWVKTDTMEYDGHT